MIDVSKLTEPQRIVYENLEGVKQTKASTDDTFLKIMNEIESGKLVMISDHGVVLIVARKTEWLAEMHIFGNSKGKQLVDSAIKITKYIFDNSEVNTIFGISHNFKFDSIIKRTGWEKFGIIPKSFWDGEKLIDQTIVGAVRQNFYNFLSERENK